MASNENEDLEALKIWWNEYGRTVVVGVVFAVFTIGGWNFWDQYQTKQAEEASSIYYQMIENYEELESSMLPQNRANPQSENPDKLVKLGAFQQSVKNLKDQYSDSEYAHYARLMAAKYYVLEQDLDAAEAELRDVLQHSPNKNLELLTTLRLARVLAESGKMEEALKLTFIQSLGSYQAAFLEVRGDIYLKQDKPQEALDAYSQARELNKEPSPDLDMKYFNLLSQ